MICCILNKQLMIWQISTPEGAAILIFVSPVAAVAPVVEDPEAVSEESCLPTFLARGFGNSRVNADIKSITKGIGTHTDA